MQSRCESTNTSFKCKTYKENCKKKRQLKRLNIDAGHLEDTAASYASPANSVPPSDQLGVEKYISVFANPSIIEPLSVISESSHDQRDIFLSPPQTVDCDETISTELYGDEIFEFQKYVHDLERQSPRVSPAPSSTDSTYQMFLTPDLIDRCQSSTFDALKDNTMPPSDPFQDILLWASSRPSP